MTYIGLSIFLIVCAVLAFFLFKKDILSPTLITCLLFLFSLILAIVGRNYWNNVIELNYKVLIIFIIAIMSFTMGELLARKLKIKNKIYNKIEEKMIKTPDIIKVNKIVLFICIGILLVTMIFFIRDINKICNIYGFETSNISEKIAFYRQKSIMFNSNASNEGANLSFYTNQLLKVSDVLFVLFSYILIRNFIKKDDFKKNIKYIIPIILCFVLSIFSSGRGLMMKYFITQIMMFAIIYLSNNDNNKKSKAKIRVVIAGVIALILIWPIFYLILPLMGRTVGFGFLEYISFYLGTPIPSFSEFINTTQMKSQIFGGETFYSIYTFLDKIHIVNYDAAISREFINFSGLFSNVYTSFRRYYFDFGVVGVGICQFIFGFIFTKMYLNAKRNESNILYVCIYCFYSYILIDQIRDELFFSSFISTTTITYLIIFIVMVYFMFRFDILNNKFKKLMERNNNGRKKCKN